MSVYVTLFNYNKKKNSTAKPVIENGFTYECRIHSPCSLTSPEIILGFENKEAAPTYNYCYIDTFKRYYFIDDWTFSEGFWIASCSIDALASWWDLLKDTKQYVIRSASQYDTYVTDLAYSATTNISTVDTVITNDYYKYQLSQGTYVIGLIGKNEDADMGAVTYVALSPGDFHQLASLIFTPTAFQDNILALSDSFFIKNMTGGIQDLMSFCKWFPFSPSDTQTSALTNLTFGWYTTAFNANKVKNFVTKTFEVALPNHPQVSRGRYLNSSPFTTRTILFPPFGEIVLDSTQLVNVNTLRLIVSTEMLTGESRLIVRAKIGENDVIVATGEGNVAVNIPLANVSENYIGAANQVVTAAIGLSSAGSSALLGASALGHASKARSHLDRYRLEKASVSENIASSKETAGAFGSVGNALSQLLPTVTTVGSRGSVADYVTRTPTIRNKFALLVDDDNEHRGKPLCKDVVLNTLEGFTVCADVEIQLASTDAERTELKSMMEGGFYIE